MQKLIVVKESIDNIRKSNNAVASAKKKTTDLTSSLRTFISDMLLANVEKGYVIPVKGSEDARSSFKALVNFVYPALSEKTQKEFSDTESLRYKCLNSNWNASIVPAAKDLASACDCEIVKKVSLLLGSSLEDGEVFKDFAKIASRVKSTMDLKSVEGLASFDEACNHAQSERESAIDLIIAENEAKTARLRKEREEIAKSYKVA